MILKLTNFCIRIIDLTCKYDYIASNVYLMKNATIKHWTLLYYSASKQCSSINYNLVFDFVYLVMWDNLMGETWMHT